MFRFIFFHPAHAATGGSTMLLVLCAPFVMIMVLALIPMLALWGVALYVGEMVVHPILAIPPSLVLLGFALPNGQRRFWHLTVTLSIALVCGVVVSCLISYLGGAAVTGVFAIMKHSATAVVWWEKYWFRLGISSGVIMASAATAIAMVGHTSAKTTITVAG